MKNYMDVFFVNSINDKGIIENDSLCNIELLIKKEIIHYLENNDVDKKRVFFTNFPFIKINIDDLKIDTENGKLIKIINNNTISELSDLVLLNKTNLVIDLNSTIASSIRGDYIDSNEIMNDFSGNIKWNYIK